MAVQAANPAAQMCLIIAPNRVAAGAVLLRFRDGNPAETVDLALVAPAVHVLGPASMTGFAVLCP